MSNEEANSGSAASGNLLNDGDEEDQELLKGDAIGDTLFSESWVIKTLMKLTEVILYFYFVMLYLFYKVRSNITVSIWLHCTGYAKILFKRSRKEGH